VAGVKGRRWRDFRYRTKSRRGVGRASGEWWGDGGRELDEKRKSNFSAPGRAVVLACQESAENCCGRARCFSRPWQLSAVSVQSILQVTKLCWRSEARIGRAQRWRSRSRGVLGQASLSANGSCPLAGSLARGRVKLDASSEHTSEVENKPARSGVSEVWSRSWVMEKEFAAERVAVPDA
jgi:hypothetical protein